MTRKQRVEHFFNSLRADRMDLLDEFYTEDVQFRDPVTSVSGLEAMKAYYRGLYKNVLEIRFEFPVVVEEGDNLFARWSMHLAARPLQGGRPFQVEGMSQLTFRGDKVAFHQDSFDVGAFFYERLPLLGWLVRRVKILLHR